MMHWMAQDQAQFMRQFVPNPTDSVIYMQYGPSLQAFRDIGGDAVLGVTYSSVVAHLQDQIGLAFSDRYRKRWGPKSTPLVGCETYDACWHWAIAAAVAGGSGAPGEHDQNRKVSYWLRYLPYRGVQGVTRYWRDPPEDPWPYQAAIPYPDATNDPSLGHGAPVLPDPGSREASNSHHATSLYHGEFPDAALVEGMNETVPESELLLSCRGVSKFFGAMAAVDNIDLDVRPGEVLGIGGPNGAGKTTLFDVVSGLTQVETGSIRFMGKEILGLSPWSIRHLGIARTFQLNAGFDNLDGA